MCLFGVLLNYTIFGHQVLLCLLSVGCWRLPYKEDLVVWKIQLCPWKTLTHIPGTCFPCAKRQLHTWLALLSNTSAPTLKSILGAASFFLLLLALAEGSAEERAGRTRAGSCEGLSRPAAPAVPSRWHGPVAAGCRTGVLAWAPQRHTGTAAPISAATMAVMPLSAPRVPGARRGGLKSPGRRANPPPHRSSSTRLRASSLAAHRRGDFKDTLHCNLWWQKQSWNRWKMEIKMNYCNERMNTIATVSDNHS